MIEEAELPTGVKSKIKIIPNNFVMESIDYKGHKIKAMPYQLPKSKRWALELQILAPNGNDILSKVFSAVNTYETEQQADLHCLNLGKQIIDSYPHFP